MNNERIGPGVGTPRSKRIRIREKRTSFGEARRPICLGPAIHAGSATREGRDDPSIKSVRVAPRLARRVGWKAGVTIAHAVAPGRHAAADSHPARKAPWRDNHEDEDASPNREKTGRRNREPSPVAHHKADKRHAQSVGPPLGPL